LRRNRRGTWLKFGSSEAMAYLLQRSAVLQGETHQAGHHVVETDQFRRTVRTLQSKKDLGWVFVSMGADVEGALSGDLDFLSDVMMASRKGSTQTLTVVYIVHVVCKSL
jgi:hypothetical protein